MTIGIISLAVPGSAAFAGEFLILAGAFQRAWWWAVIGAGGIVLAAMYMLRWYSALAHEGDGEKVAPETPDLRLGELAIAVPLILILFALTAYPWGVMQRVATSQVAFDTPAKVQQL
jgi:NADH:ubiquinone oxidoreductase subunit 4 (subunit M)